jgi:hypothetical protein
MRLIGVATPGAAGTAVGRQVTGAAMSVVFPTLATGSIFYVVRQLLGAAHKSGHKDLHYREDQPGQAAGFLTDEVVTAGSSHPGNP